MSAQIKPPVLSPEEQTRDNLKFIHRKHRDDKSDKIAAEWAEYNDFTLGLVASNYGDEKEIGRRLKELFDECIEDVEGMRA